jgi:Polyketide cyclase / dehydrase and lipid transport
VWAVSGRPGQYAAGMWWRRAKTPEVFAESVVIVPGPVERVWALLHSPSSAVALGVAIDAWREPGTPVGVGEIQVYVYEVDGDRKTSRNRVLKYEEGRRAVTEALDSEFQEFAETTVTPVGDDGSVQVAHRGWFLLPRDTPLQTCSLLQAAADQWADGITEHLPGLCDPRRRA